MTAFAIANLKGVQLFFIPLKIDAHKKVLNGLAPGLPKEANEHRFSCVGFVRRGLRYIRLTSNYQYFHLLANFTNDNITGTSTNTPTTVTNAAGDCKPNKAIATATASSKKLLAPIMAAGEAIL